MHEKPFLPGERYSISREMERNVKGYKVMIRMITIMVMMTRKKSLARAHRLAMMMIIMRGAR